MGARTLCGSPAGVRTRDDQEGHHATEDSRSREGEDDGHSVVHPVLDVQAMHADQPGRRNEPRRDVLPAVLDPIDGLDMAFTTQQEVRQVGDRGEWGAVQRTQEHGGREEVGRFEIDQASLVHRNRQRHVHTRDERIVRSTRLRCSHPEQ